MIWNSFQIGMKNLQFTMSEETDTERKQDNLDVTEEVWLSDVVKSEFEKD